MDGYTRLAALMADQNDYALFRRYMPLRALRLLHLSAKITRLSSELGLAIEQDRNADDLEKRDYESYYRKLENSQHSVEPSKQLDLWDQLSSALKEQGDALLLYRSLLHLPAASGRHLKHLREWLRDDDGGHYFLHGAEASVWSEANEQDLTSISLHQSKQEDPVTTLIHSKLLPLYHRAYGKEHKEPVKVQDPFTDDKQSMPIVYYSDRVILYLVNTLSTMLASMIPAVCTLALYFIDTPLARLGAIIGFTFLFSAVLTLVTNVERSQCFGITAAFSAVLVVFIGNNAGVGCEC